MSSETVDLNRLEGIGRCRTGGESIAELYRAGEHYILVLYGPKTDGGGKPARFGVKLNREQVRAVAMMLMESPE